MTQERPQGFWWSPNRAREHQTQQGPREDFPWPFAVDGLAPLVGWSQSFGEQPAPDDPHG
jgi:hypothetical protein